jgi:hypothetical protein
MAAVAVRPRKARGARAQILVWLILGVALLFGAITALYFSTQNELLSSYRAALVCASREDADAGRDCRYTAPATVTAILGSPGGDSVDLALPELYGPSFTARLAAGSVADTLHVGDQVSIELWRYRVTQLAGRSTLDNPVNDPRPRDLLFLGLPLLLLGLGATGWGLISARRARGGEEGDLTSAARMSPIATSDALWR